MTAEVTALGISLAAFIALARAGRCTGRHSLTWLGAALFMTAVAYTAFASPHDHNHALPAPRHSTLTATITAHCKPYQP